MKLRKLLESQENFDGTYRELAQEAWDSYEELTSIDNFSTFNDPAAFADEFGLTAEYEQHSNIKKFFKHLDDEVTQAIKDKDDDGDVKLDEAIGKQLDELFNHVKENAKTLTADKKLEAANRIVNNFIKHLMNFDDYMEEHDSHLKDLASDNMEYKKDPHAYYGVKQSDF